MSNLAGGPCDEHAHPRCYIASPIFNPEQLAVVAAVETMLHEQGYISYSPARDGIMLAPHATPSEMQQVYLSNVRAIEQSDLLVAIMDDKDTGTTMEFGAAVGRRIPIISFSPRTKRRNVMLSQGVLAHVESLHDLRTVLTEARPFLLYGRKITHSLLDTETVVRGRFDHAFRYRGETQ